LEKDLRNDVDKSLNEWKTDYRAYVNEKDEAKKRAMADKLY
jgi:hypothetical protein